MDSNDWVSSGYDGASMINWVLLDKEQGDKADGCVIGLWGESWNWLVLM